MFETGLPIIPLVILLVLISGTIAFWYYFISPANELEKVLADIIEKVDVARSKGLRDLNSCFEDDERIASVWKEYSDTLHVQKTFDPNTGGMFTAAVRSTVPAEIYLSSQNIVDSRIHSEFFKHFPGIFTGIGIIGTFFGLLSGLSGFEISEDSKKVQASLTELLHGVSEAFVISASAIFLAMLCTFIEKYLLNSLNGKVARLAHAVDGTYESGAGEEYLARLVNSSEESASQTRILKDALVTDLKEILTEIAERQIAATQTNTENLGKEIGNQIKTVLEGPLNQVSKDQSSAVTQLLADVLASFSTKLEGMFGSQLTGISDMQQKTIEAMQTAVAKLNDLVDNIENAGSNATQAMSEKLLETLKAVEDRQAALSQELSNVLREIRAGTGEMQKETQGKLEELLGQLGTTMAATIAAIERQAADRSKAQGEEEEKRANVTAGHVGKIGEAVTGLKAEVDELVSSVRAMASSVEETTRNAFTRLNSGADTLLSAAGKFEAAGLQAAGSFEQMASVSSELAGAAGSVAGAARSLDSVVGDYKAARDTVAAMVDSLRSTVDSASREAALTQDVLQRIEGAAKKLADAQQNVDGFLDEVVDVIAASHEKFADGMRGTVVEANRHFHTELTQATGLLKEAIQELELALPAGQRPRV